MTDMMTAWLRTVVPGWWAGVVTWLVGLGLPEQAGTWLNGAVDVIILPAMLAVVYAAIRWAEPRTPVWLRRVLAGSTRTPTYTPLRQRATLTGDGDQ